MKKVLMMITLLVILSLAMTACGPKQTGARTVSTGTAEPAVVDEAEETSGEEPAEMPAEEPEETAEEIKIEYEEPGVAGPEEEPEEVESSLSQEDLDKLGADIEGIAVEDLGGLSE